jgi:hypothetical protein
MSRGIGNQQRRILEVLAENGHPMTRREINQALALGQRFPSDTNLSQKLTGLARRGLILLTPGHWTRSKDERAWQPTSVCLPR